MSPRTLLGLRLSNTSSSVLRQSCISQRSSSLLLAKRRHLSLRVRRNGISTAHILGAAAVITVTAAGTVLWNIPSGVQGAEVLVSANSSSKMTMKPAPGRPGTLTAEQEAKLREWWSQYSREFGPPEHKAGVGGAKADDISIGELGGGGGGGGGGGDDKHGVTKLYKQAMANNKPEELREAFWDMVKHDHPDAIALRFLRARKWDVRAAFVMATAALHWRLADAKVDSDIMRNGELEMLKLAEGSDATQKKVGVDFMTQIRLGKSFLHDFDKEGRPLCVVRVRLHRAGEQSERSLERFTVYTIETARMMLKSPVDTATILFDMTDFSLSNMDYAPVKFMIRCFEANYPESLGAVLVHKAPWLFQGIWRVIRGWLDPVVVNKVHFTNNVKDLENYIEKSKIINELGGPNGWSYSYVEPSLDENSAMADEATKKRLFERRKELSIQYEETIREWLRLPDGVKVDWDQYRQKRQDIAELLRENYWELDPYVRARSVYDRTEEIKPDK